MGNYVSVYPSAPKLVFAPDAEEDHGKRGCIRGRGLVLGEVHDYFLRDLLRCTAMPRPCENITIAAFSRWLKATDDFWESVPSDSRNAFRALVAERGVPVRQHAAEKVERMCGDRYAALDFETKALIALHWAHVKNVRSSRQANWRSTHHHEPPAKRHKKSHS